MIREHIHLLLLLMIAYSVQVALMNCVQRICMDEIRIIFPLYIFSGVCASTSLWINMIAKESNDGTSPTVVVFVSVCYVYFIFHTYFVVNSVHVLQYSHVHTRVVRVSNNKYGFVGGTARKCLYIFRMALKWI